MIRRFFEGLGKKMENPVDTEFLYVLLPEPLGPLERGARYEDPIDAELRLAGLGYVSGGGAQLSELKEDGTRDIEYCGVDVDATDVDGARALLRLHLPELGCPPGTRVQYDDIEDWFDGSDWLLAQPRSSTED